MTFHSYLKLVAWLLLICSIAVVGLNWLIDPFYLFEAPKISGLNVAKTGFFQHLRLMKPLVLEVKHHAFDTIIMGSSRAEAGLDPEHPVWAHSKVYNLSIPVPSMYEVLRYSEFAHEVQDLRTVVLALDFSQFDDASQIVSNYELDHLLRSIHSPSNHYRAGNLATTLFSIDALSASLRTVVSQHNPKVQHTALGFGIHAWRRLEVARVGQRAMFIDNDSQYITGHWVRNGQRAYVSGSSDSKPLVYFRLLVEKCRMNGSRLIVILSPSHAREWSSIWAAGLWPHVEQWKRDLVSILTDDASRHSQEPPFVLWDFSGYNSITTEEVPPGGDTNTEMKWYWEASHYKKEVGDMMLEKIFGSDDPPHEIPADFGTKLTRENIEEHLLAMREQQLLWHAQHEQDLQEIRALIELAKSQGSGKSAKKV